MCGINGFTNKNDARMSLMNKATKHRGPDGVGVWGDEHITLGQNLLAITETPSLAKQPCVTRDANFVMVYNGEVYNYKSLRSDLVREGARFETDGDTEVVFEGLMRHGPEYFARLDGMFAIAFYDKAKAKLFLARDRAGMKPLYTAQHEGSLVFSSEMRGLFAYGIRPILDVDSARTFFLFGYPPTEKTLIRGITKIPPGTYKEFDLKTKTATDVVFGWNDRIMPDTSYSPEMLRECYGKAVSEHTMGLRPFGLFLSGGLDSTVVLHELAEREKGMVKTYTTRFDTQEERYNEDADLAKRLTKEYRIDHHELLVTEKDFIGAYEKAIIAMEEPRYNHSVPAYWLLAQMASKDITVVLDGSGGDELFLGYPRYLSAVNIEKKYAQYPGFMMDFYYSLRAHKEELLRFPNMLHMGKLLDEWAYVNKITPPSRNPAFRFMDDFDMTSAIRILKEENVPPILHPLSDRTNAVAELDRWYWLANEEFLRMDKVMMHFGMEGRFPFLANDVVRYANTIPSAQKLAHGTKGLVRESYRGRLPDYILNKKKTGWNAPVAEWMHGDFGKMVREILSKDYYYPTDTLFNFDVLKRREIYDKTTFTLKDLKRFLPIVQFQVWAKAFNVEIPR